MGKTPRGGHPVRSEIGADKVSNFCREEEGLPILNAKLMERQLNSRLNVPSFEASALKGKGIAETLKKCLTLTLGHLRKELKWSFNQSKEEIMKRSIAWWVCVGLLSMFLIGSTAFAKGKGKGRPPGWDKGEKKGWQSDVPPGQMKKEEAQEGSEEGKKEKKKKDKKEKNKKTKEDDAEEEKEAEEIE